MEDLWFALKLHSTGLENYSALLWYLIWTVHEKTCLYIKITIFVTYRPIKSLSKVMFLYQVQNGGSVTGQLGNDFNWSTGDDQRVS